MKSNVCTIENGSKDLAAIFAECEKVAEYIGLTHKQGQQLRLLCEELDGMLPAIIDDFSGDFWIEFADGVCKVRASIEFAEFTAEKKKELVAVSRSKKNAATVGIVGKIRSALENFFMDEETLQAYALSAAAFSPTMGYAEGMDYSYLWTLDQYRAGVKKEGEGEQWDELEKSVVAAVADDVIVGVKGKHADITIVKKFM